MPCWRGKTDSPRFNEEYVIVLDNTIVIFFDGDAGTMPEPVSILRMLPIPLQPYSAPYHAVLMSSMSRNCSC